MIEEAEENKPHIFTIKTQIGKEEIVANLLEKRAKKAKADILSILVAPELRGYLFVETYDKQQLKNMIKTISYVRGMLDGETNIQEIEHFLTPASSVAKIAEGDIVEMIAGPFRGETAKVIHIDDAKEEITVELFEALVPIPITVRGEQVRVIKRKEEEK
ncbi:transcription elongation factor Spt5 [Euryarchaeota archaeon ex4484_162]|mgnify:CR=1 FL=1|nr:transcription elongation factor Spt5 [Thermoplasmata archaeon]OYT58415.1 MAG: transcription elongation factor Spt5 [Euryarchaeota archaeon ex4484_162]RLF31251.1 MAG: transcription elongation factor Spt5 [Thermoplasmata archaeon]RLF62940.1 MAG: transcription elongation factor Spt5 [Thermoplasmata archaeon]HDM24973.1 transcription elongation factor Spt5 [Thermoplasmatales archaeon]